jgi:hypothetical protein
MKINRSFYSLLFAVFGFMMIIATGVDFLLGSENIPLIVSIIGLIMIIIAMVISKKEKSR